MKRIICLTIIFAFSLSLAGCKNERAVSMPSNTEALPAMESSQTDLLLNSVSVKEFSDDVVTDAQIEILLKAAIKSPSAYNNQPWHFTAVMKEKYIRQIVPAATKGCVLIIVSSPSGGGNMFDCGIAAQSIYLAAQSMGLGANIYSEGVNAINSSELKNDLKIPEGYDAAAIVCAGYAKTDAVSGASERKSFDEIVTYID